jgi:hypothetical protein
MWKATPIEEIDVINDNINNLVLLIPTNQEPELKKLKTHL